VRVATSSLLTDEQTARDVCKGDGNGPDKVKYSNLSQHTQQKGMSFKKKGVRKEKSHLLTGVKAKVRKRLEVPVERAGPGKGRNVRLEQMGKPHKGTDRLGKDRDFRRGWHRDRLKKLLP